MKREELIKKYEELIEPFKDIILGCTNLLYNPTIKKMQIEQLLKQYVIFETTPKELVSLPKLLNCVEFINKKILQTIYFLKEYETAYHTQDIMQYIMIRNLIGECIKIVNNTTEIQHESRKTMESIEVLNEIREYYRSIMDLDFVSQSLPMLVSRIPNQDPDKTDPIVLSQIWENTEEIWRIIKRKIEQIRKRFKTDFIDSGQLVLDNLEGLRMAIIEKLPKEILRVFISLTHHLLDFITNLTDKMHNFIIQFGYIVSNKGFCKMEMRLPSIKVDSIFLFLSRVPIPKLDFSEITVSSEPKRELNYD